MEKYSSRIKNKEMEYDMLYSIRDIALLYSKINPDNLYVEDLMEYLDIRISLLTEMMDDEGRWNGRHPTR